MMDFKVLHEQFKDDDSPTVEGQIRWLQKQGFAQHQIEQAMITVYSEIERQEVPKMWARKVEEPGGKIIVEKVYLSKDTEGPINEKFPWSGRDVVTGFELDQYLLSIAKNVRTDELTVMVLKMEEFEGKLRSKWEKERSDKKKQAEEILNRGKKHWWNKK